MAKPSRKSKQAFWERGYQGHGYWLGKQKLGSVTLEKKGEGGGLLYCWEADTHAGEATSLDEAKRAVEQAVLVGASQLPLFDPRAE